MLSLATLFFTAFLAATILPFYSELLLATLLIQGLEPINLWFWATLGNTLGAVVNWALARYFLSYSERRWFPFNAANLGYSQRWFQRYGKWSLLMAWAPIGGDALTFIAGLMKVRLPEFLLLVAIGKGARYAVVIWMLKLTEFA